MKSLLALTVILNVYGSPTGQIKILSGSQIWSTKKFQLMNSEWNLLEEQLATPVTSTTSSSLSPLSSASIIASLSSSPFSFSAATSLSPSSLLLSTLSLSLPLLTLSSSSLWWLLLVSSSSASLLSVADGVLSAVLSVLPSGLSSPPPPSSSPPLSPLSMVLSIPSPEPTMPWSMPIEKESAKSGGCLS